MCCRNRSRTPSPRCAARSADLSRSRVAETGPADDPIYRPRALTVRWRETSPRRTIIAAMPGDAHTHRLVSAARLVGVRDERVLDAMTAVPRAAYVPPGPGARGELASRESEQRTYAILRRPDVETGAPLQERPGRAAGPTVDPVSLGVRCLGAWCGSAYRRSGAGTVGRRASPPARYSFASASARLMLRCRVGATRERSP